MKKIIYFGHDVEIGNMIEIKGLRCEITQQLVDDNPSYFKVEDKPMYFKCIKGEGEYNKGRIYKQVDNTRYPEIINPISEKGYDLAIYNWQSDYINESRKCFELTTKAEWDKQELLDEAKRRYPVGTVYKHFNSEYTINSPDMLTVGAMNHHFSFGTSIWVTSEAYNGVVYKDGKWAEILPLKFTTEDGVDIYGDMKTYLVHSNDSDDICFSHGIWDGNSMFKSYKYFCHKENALAYIKRHREKTLKDYESILHANKKLLDYSSYHDGAGYNVSVGVFFKLLKANEPKLYYTKILQLIADDLHGGRYTHIHMNTSYHINNTYGVNVHCGYDEGCVYFRSNELAVKARDIMGSKLDYLFN